MAPPSVLIATTNSGKLAEFRRLLSPAFDCIGVNDSRLGGREEPHVTEDGLSYQENALKKAKTYFESFGMEALADDSGLEVGVLKGAPGVFSARWGGESLSWPQRWEKLYQALSQYPIDQWNARFVCVLCYYDGTPQHFEAMVEGKISPMPHGNGGFGYDPIFMIPPLGKTFGEITAEEKAKYGHRGLATKAFSEWYQRTKSSCS